MEPGTKSITITAVFYFVSCYCFIPRRISSDKYLKKRFQFLTCSLHLVSGYVLYKESEAEQFLNLAAAAYADSSEFVLTKFEKLAQNKFRSGNVTARQSCIDISFPTEDFHVLMVMSTPCDKRGNQCQAFIAISDSTNQVIISFRGTNSGGQLLSEFGDGLEDYVPYTEVDGSNNTVHVGHVNVYFLNAMSQMWDDMVEPSIVSRRDYKYLLTGHSLGGAMATLTAFRISFRQFSSKIKVHTFGEPRVGDIVFASYFTVSCSAIEILKCLKTFLCKITNLTSKSSRYFQDMVPYAFRVVHNTDPIPHLPPLSVDNETSPGMPYHHPREIWYNDDFSSYVLCSDVNGEDWSCSDKKRFWNYGSKGAYRHTHYFNHFVSEYGSLGCNSTPQKQTFTFLILMSIVAILCIV
ncbi:hypothetical protein CAEBREN_10632 [Caenorhabditis brenneri]|uniref:Fungal lipase-type domain-containing protein n=1 Tax=Caenorhabditis brenneri TaxID=135651 RepID=G0MAP2_CAEBE|nr:hypothetical protein CAEBREN_10632 [Caenorhabditis brenneri]